MHQHGCAEYDTAIAFLSVCPSVTRWYCVITTRPQWTLHASVGTLAFWCKSKMMEIIVVSNTLDYRCIHGLISFIIYRSTNLLGSLNDDWAINFDSGSCQTVAYFDFAKAFASMCHSKLITKLRHWHTCRMWFITVNQWLCFSALTLLVGPQ